jgi:hypothetical protein
MVRILNGADTYIHENLALLNPSMKFFRETGAARLSKKFHSTNQQYRKFNA